MDRDELIASAIAIHVDTEGMDAETYDSIVAALTWALDKLA